ncbi:MULTISPECIES: M48 family metallopeptidase [unclassified Helicobacter]|uniref:M48 family metallopeptidase n=1 Tax=unclassified Helicobacter TaxID=2593540 RepID=UPI000CF10274|nr:MULTISPECIES: SprT family zinc-dependent metalloprotease [unclassified Helicobacter]
MQAKVIYKDIKNFILKVKPSLEVILSVPRHTSAKEIDYILQKRKGWIENALQRFQALQPISPKEFVSGEDFEYLGKHYRLKVIPSTKEEIRINGAFVELLTKKENDFLHKQKLIKQWYQKRALECFSKLLDSYAKLLGFEVKTLRIRTMKTRWGSCNPKKASINLNLELIKKDKREIEYVILHELAHLKYPYHNQDFYHFVALYMPDWKDVRAKLNGIKA